MAGHPPARQRRRARGGRGETSAEGWVGLGRGAHGLLLLHELLGRRRDRVNGDAIATAGAGSLAIGIGEPRASSSEPPDRTSASETTIRPPRRSNTDELLWAEEADDRPVPICRSGERRKARGDLRRGCPPRSGPNCPRGLGCRERFGRTGRFGRPLLTRAEGLCRPSPALPLNGEIICTRRHLRASIHRAFARSGTPGRS